jgi:hypothetical protein
MIYFDYLSGFPLQAQATGRFLVLCDEDNATGLSINSIDHLAFICFAQIKPNTADQAGVNIPFGWMTDQVGRFVQHQQGIIFVDNGEKWVQ